MKTFIQIHPTDTVAVALTSLKKGTVIHLDNRTVTLTEDIPQGHKFALTDISEGSSVIKYGNSILSELPQHRLVRNEIWIIPTVGCVNNVAQAIEKASQKFISDHIDGIIAFTHPYGCSQMGDDQENTRKILADLINHLNAGGVLVLGLGCENSNIDILKDYIGEYDPERVRFLVAQESYDEISDGTEIVRELSEYVKQFLREPVSCSKLVIGMKCSGSDGLSGIS